MDSWTNGAEGPLKTSAPQKQRGATMVDRVSVSISIGGRLPADRLDELVEKANAENLSIEWDGEPFTADDLPDGEPLVLRGHEIANGKVDELEDFCCKYDLPFWRWSGGAPGAFPAEIVLWKGVGERHAFTADEHGNPVLTSDEANDIATLEELREHFATGAYLPPPFVIVPTTAE